MRHKHGVLVESLGDAKRLRLPVRVLVTVILLQQAKGLPRGLVGSKAGPLGSPPISWNTLYGTLVL